MSLEKLREAIKDLSPAEGAKYLNQELGGDVVFSTSFGIEDQVLTHLLLDSKEDFSTFTLDTGRLFPETYEVFQRTQGKYKLAIDTYYPDPELIGDWVKEKGINSFYNSVENRKECCGLRKVVQLKKALAGKKVWITGLRAEQSDNRQSMELLEWDEGFQLYKYNPLIDWSYDQLEKYVDENNVPINSLHKKGFVSIGCQPCTRAIEPGEDFRAGRWWWEESKKECGLHT